MSESSGFGRRLTTIIVGLFVVSFAVGLMAPVFTEVLDPAEVTGPSTYSRSALGHQGLERFLRALGHDVEVARTRAERAAVDDAILVLAEPIDEVDELRGRLDQAEDVLLILPKRRALWAGENGWIKSQDAVVEASVDAVLEAIEVEGEVVRSGISAAGVEWTKSLGPTAPRLEDMQLMRLVSGNVEELVACDAGVLVARIELPWGGSGIILSDPDVIANHGLDEDANALFLVRLLREFTIGDRAFVIDEGIHGLGASDSIYSAMFRFPLVLVTLQALAVACLLLWSAGRRFGTPLPPPPPIPPGKGFLIENTARLLDFGGHRDSMLRRYLEASVRAVARGVHAPGHLRGAELDAWLQRVTKARGSSVDVSELRRSVSKRSRKSASTSGLAKRIHNWRTEMLDGS